jgi:probable F420-dependent oxidoreductase
MKIGVVLLIAEGLEIDGRTPRYPEIRQMATLAEEAGFDSIWVYDHLFYEPEGVGRIGIWECWTIVSALAEATSRVEIGTLVICNSFRNPALLAKMAHTVDEVCGGRFILGIGAGWNKPEFDAFGYPFDHRVDGFEEALQIIRPLIKDGRVDFQGKYHKVPNCEIIPRGPRTDGIPLLVGSFGPRMMRLTAQYADMWNTAYVHQPSSLEEPLAKIRQACVEVGRDMNTLEITATVGLGFPECGRIPNFMKKHLTGSKEEIAEAMRAYERMGVSHLIFHCSPYNEEVLGLLAEGMNHYRAR